MTFEQFFTLCAEKEHEKPHWRPGQAMFNTLLDVRPDVADLVRGTANDPFYASRVNDSRIANFVNIIKRFFPKTAKENDPTAQH